MDIKDVKNQLVIILNLQSQAFVEPSLLGCP